MAPTTVEIYPLFNCNQRCSFCYVGEFVERPPLPPLAPGHIAQLCENLHRAGVFHVALLGGEPFLYRHLDALLDELGTRGFDLSIATNGSAAERADLRTLARWKVKLDVSIQSSDWSVHDRLVRREGAFDAAVALCGRLVAEGIPVVISCVLTSAVAASAVQYVRFARTIGVTAVLFHAPERTSYALDRGMDIPFWSFAKAVAEARAEGQLLGVRVDSNCHYDFLMGNAWPRPDVEHPLAAHLYGDKSGRSRIEVLPNGDAYPGYEFFMKREWLVGNLLEDDLRHVWQESRALQRVRERRLPSECGACQHRLVCQGGLLSRPLLTGRPDAPPNDCPILCNELEAVQP